MYDKQLLKMSLITHRSYKKLNFKVYSDLRILEKDLRSFQSLKECHFQISVLGNTAEIVKAFAFCKQNEIYFIKQYWKAFFTGPINFGSFYNNEFGQLFIVGHLAPIFMYKINKKPLAMLSSGLYGILRGLGAGETEVTYYLKELSNARFLLIIRESKNKV